MIKPNESYAHCTKGNFVQWVYFARSGGAEGLLPAENAAFR